jgi:hypothetical protein
MGYFGRDNNRNNARSHPTTGRDARSLSSATAPRDTRPQPRWAGRRNDTPAPKGGWDGDRDRDHAKAARAEWM